MYRVIFKHQVKEGQGTAFMHQWQKGSDVIQSYPGALGTKLFRGLNEPGYLYAMADWESKNARDTAIESIQTRSDAQQVLHGHEEYVDSHTVFGTFELIAESHQPTRL